MEFMSTLAGFKAVRTMVCCKGRVATERAGVNSTFGMAGPMSRKFTCWQAAV